jgi:hypothetical protein
MTDHPFDLLGRELDAAAARQVAPAPRSQRSRLRLLVITVVAGLGLSAAAWAAGSLLSGDPVAYRYGAPPSPDTHYGTTVAGSVELLADDVPDPDGGLPWGLRSFTTSRGFGCVQVGRVQEGKLGVLALVQRGGKVSARGEFHELRPAVLSQATTCLPLDGDGHAFLALHVLATTDAVPPICPLRRQQHGPGVRMHSSVPDCRGKDVRTIDAGLLGPRAASITSRVDGTERTAPARGDARGYLVVQRGARLATTSRKFARGVVRLATEAWIALTPASAVITRVAYRDAPPCAVKPSTSPDGACADPPGFMLIPQPRAKDVRATIRAFAAPNRRGVRLRFRAPVAVKDGRSAYTVTIHVPRGSYGTQLDRNVRAGELVRTTIDVPNLGKDHHPALRRGVHLVVVSYQVQPPRPRYGAGLAYPGYRVGEARIVVR